VALRSFIRSRAIDCDVPAGADEIPDPARCVVGTEDIAEWLVAQGWAKRNGDAYEEAEKKASEEKLGLFGSARPDAQEVATRR
jgi:endonuclease YncB( thermonuclease family)